MTPLLYSAFRELGATDSIVIELAPPTASISELFPEERSAVEKAVDKRQREFATSRVLARKALGRLGAPQVAILPQPDRYPTWPSGYVGTISHTSNWVAVAVAPAHEQRALGLDLELNTPLEPRLWSMIATKTELDWLKSLSSQDAGLAGKLLFSAKESLYKCQYTLTRTFLEFQEAELSLDLSQGTYRGRVLHPQAKSKLPSVLNGFLRITPDTLATGMCL